MNPNLQTFNHAMPFDELSPDIKVNSDHASIACLLKYPDFTFTIGATNISNKEYHKYFGSGPFKSTHMYVPTNDSTLLQSKTELQMNSIIEEITHNIDVQIIIEGYYDFYTNLMAKLPDYKLVSVLNNRNHGYESSPENISGILISPKVKVIETGTYQILYSENNKNATLIIPWVRISYLDRSLIILAVHLPGCDSQFPSSALFGLNKYILYLKEKYNEDIIAMGDFNTVPENITSSMAFAKIVEPKYLTHINPNNDVAVYDNAVYNFKSTDIEIELLDIETQPEDSKAFVKCLNENYMLSQNK